MRRATPRVAATRAGRARALAVLGTALGLGCATLGAPPDPLGELHPYLWLREGVLSARLCRWPDGARVSVAADAQARPQDRALLTQARRALGDLELPLELVAAEPGETPSIRVVFEDAPPARSGGRAGSGRTDAVCALDPRSGAAQLAAARVQVGRGTGPDVRGRARPLAADERLGALLHELGHALGYQGHPPRGDALLSPAPEAVRRLGQRALRGERIASPGLRALYARPSGTLRWSVPVAAWRSAPVDALAERAAAAGWPGPYLRVGDRAARIGWLAGDGREPGVVLPDLRGVLEQPARVLAIPLREAPPVPPAAAPSDDAAAPEADGHFPRPGPFAR